MTEACRWEVLPRPKIAQLANDVQQTEGGKFQLTRRGQLVYLDVAVDGTLQGGTYGIFGVGGNSGGHQHNLSFTFWTDVLSAASHTIKLQFSVDGGTGTIFRSATAPAIWTVIETALTT